MLLNLIPVSAFAETEDLVEDVGSMTVSGTTDGDDIVDNTEGETDKQNAPEKDSEAPTVTEEPQDEAAEEGDTQDPSPDSGEEEQSTEEADGESAEEDSEIRLTEGSVSVTLGERTITAAGLMPEDAWLFAAEIPAEQAQKLLDAAGDGRRALAAWDLSVIYEGAKFQPGEHGTEIDITINSVDEAADAEGVALLHVLCDVVNDAGEPAEDLIDMTAAMLAEGLIETERPELTRSGPEISFRLESFSVVILTANAAIETTDTAANASTEAATTETATNAAIEASVDVAAEALQSPQNDGFKPADNALFGAAACEP